MFGWLSKSPSKMAKIAISVVIFVLKSLFSLSPWYWKLLMTIGKVGAFCFKMIERCCSRGRWLTGIAVLSALIIDKFCLFCLKGLIWLILKWKRLIDNDGEVYRHFQAYSNANESRLSHRIGLIFTENCRFLHRFGAIFWEFPVNFLMIFRLESKNRDQNYHFI